MTIREAVSRLRNNLKEFYGDSVLSNRHLYNIIYTMSLAYLERDKRTLYNLDIFTPVNIDAEEVNIYEGSCVILDCKVCRYKLEDLMENKYGFIYKYVGTPDYKNQYHITSPNTYNRKTNIRGNKTKYGWIENEYIYIPDCPPCIKVLYLSSNGVSLNSVDGCSIMDNKLTIPDYLIDNVIKGSMSELQIFIAKNFDVTENKNPNN